ncbi:hypothetical protein QCA50_017735 [Cerrena zonata]|uniref:Uncharacterized protein n=1 Tax=Cerrena zonata TaxID=2478898 RepID=A0AAW0F962_9APHY
MCPVHNTALSKPTGSGFPRYTTFYIPVHLLRTTPDKAASLGGTHCFAISANGPISNRASSRCRLFISALMLASKTMCDATYSNRFWEAATRSVLSLREINQREQEMCRVWDGISQSTLLNFATLCWRFTMTSVALIGTLSHTLLSLQHPHI